MPFSNDFERKNMELQKRVDQLSSELGDARNSLVYMNQLLVALKTHKKATAAAKTALEKLQLEVQERDTEIASLQKEKLRMQDARKNLTSELEESEMSMMQTIAAAEEARKEHVAMIQQIEAQHKVQLQEVNDNHLMKVQEMTHDHANAIDTMRQKLDHAIALETETIVSILVFKAIDTVKTDEADHLRARIVKLQSQINALSQNSETKEHEIGELGAVVLDKDLRIGELQQELANQCIEIQHLQATKQEQDEEKAGIIETLSAARLTNKELNQEKIDMAERHQMETAALEESIALLHSRYDRTGSSRVCR